MSEEEEIETVEYDAIIGEINRILKAKRKRIVTENGKIIKETVGHFYTASCGHLIHDSSEIGGKCSIKECNSIVCKDCLKQCSRCLRALCTQHQHRHNDGLVYCPKCKIIVMLVGGLVSRKPSRNESGRSLSRSLGELLFGPL